MNRMFRLIAVLTVVMLTGMGALIRPAAAQDDDIRIVIVSHGQASDPFWSVVQNGVNQAAKDMGVTGRVPGAAAPSTWWPWRSSSTPPWPPSRMGWSSRSPTPTPLGRFDSARPSTPASR